MYAFGRYKKEIRDKYLDLYNKFHAIKEYSRHGGALDRGEADSWYERPVDPHYYAGATGASEKIMITDTESEAYDAYMAGYIWNDELHAHKDWG